MKKKLLFTGANGFVGSSVMPILDSEYEIVTLGLGANNKYDIDLSKESFVLGDSVDIVLHAAGKAHVVPKTEEESELFFRVNYQGTVNLCKALEIKPPKSFVLLSTVAVYGCETGLDISEDHPLNGSTPYAKSKIAAERYLTEWCSINGVNLTILRPSLLAGRNPPGNLGAMIKGISTGRYVNIGGGRARKSVAMASDIARIIPLVETRGGVFNLCDDHHPSFSELETSICRQLNRHLPLSIPYRMIVPFARLGDVFGWVSPINTLKLDKISKSLTFSNDKIKRELSFTPSDVLANFCIR